MGTLAYMAPESGRGSYGPAADIYSLGLVLHELLTGRHPFSGETPAELLLKHLLENPALEDLPQPFRSVVGKALEKRPEDRCQSVGEMARALRAPSDPALRVPCQPAPRLPEPVNAGGKKAAGAKAMPFVVLVAVALVLFLLALFSAPGRPTPPPRPIPPARPIRLPVPVVVELPAGRSLEDRLRDRQEAIRIASQLAGEQSKRASRWLTRWVRGQDPGAAPDEVENWVARAAGASSTRAVEALANRFFEEAEPGGGQSPSKR